MVEPEKPFACTMPDCGMTFTNEDHLNVHTKKHDMVLQFGCEQKAAVFVADQTPTPTRFIRNCEEVGLFQDLQNVNPFDEGFKRAIETKQGILGLEAGCTPSNEDLHTPQMFPLLDPGDSVFSATNNHHNITISRSSSDETGAIKEFETTRISKLTNEVTTISRIVEKHDEAQKNKDSLQKNSVSYTNNVIKIHSNVEIRKDLDKIEDVIKDGVLTKDGIVKEAYDRLQVEVPPIMSQKSIDFVMDSLTTDFITEKAKDAKSTKEEIKDVKMKKEDYEVILKLPSGQEIKLVNADGAKDKPRNAKDLLKKVLTDKVETQKIISHLNIIPSVIPTITSGTLIPVSIVNTNLVNTNLVNTNLVNTNLVNTNYIPKLPLKVFDKRPIKRKGPEHTFSNKVNKDGELDASTGIMCGMKNETQSLNQRRKGSSKGALVINELESRSAASRRYRARLKETMAAQAQENKLLKESNERLTSEMAALKTIIMEHMRRCHCADDIRQLQETMRSFETNSKD